VTVRPILGVVAERSNPTTDSRDKSAEIDGVLSVIAVAAIKTCKGMHPIKWTPPLAFASLVLL